MSDLTPEDRRWLDAAVRIAALSLGTTADNPAVAALIVEPSTQTLIARATTAPGGRPHAEAQALEAAGFDAAGCTLYVTLEPCHHWGRTPPCVDAIIRAGIMRVVIGVADPSHPGGMALLESAGIAVVLADHAPSRALHAGHLLRHEAGRPFVTAVLALSSDGKIDGSGEGRVSVLGDTAHHWRSLQRAHADAILIGAAAAASDPDLTVALAGLSRRTPPRFVLAGASGVDRRLNLVGGFSGYRTVVIAEHAAPVDAPASVEVIRVSGKDGRPDLVEALRAIALKGLQNLVLEPGPRLLQAMLEADFVDSVAVIAARGVIGPSGIAISPDGPVPDLLEAAGLVETDRQRLGEDSLTRYGRSRQPV